MEMRVPFFFLILLGIWLVVVTCLSSLNLVSFSICNGSGAVSSKSSWDKVALVKPHCCTPQIKD